MRSLTVIHCALVAAMLSMASNARAAGGSWYNSSWSYRLAITLDHTKVSGPLTNFPVLISFTNASVKASALASGNDLLFTSADGTTKLNHEIEAYTSSNGALVAWVQVPLLSSTADTNLYLYYGNSTSTNQQNAAGVWDANYKGVWHFQQTPTGSAGDMADSTSGNNDGSSQTIAASAQVAGRIGGGLTLDGISDYISTTTSFANPQTLMLEAWVKTTGNGKKVVGFENTQTETSSTTVDREIYFGTNGNAYFGTYNPTTSTTEVAGSTNTLNNGQWHLLVGYRDNAGSTIGLYVDGVLQATRSSSAIQSYTGWYRIGAYKSSGWPNLVADGYFPGSVDEVRVSHAIRSSAWISTEFANQGSPATFYSVGNPENPPATKLAITSINGGSSPMIGATFNVVVQSQDAGGTARNVTADTVVTLSLNTGTGTLGGIVTGTITNGSSSVTISGIIYSKAESGVIITATRTSGDTLTAANSSAFTVNGWYNASWTNRIAIVIDHTKVSSNQTNFPVLINFTNASLKASALSSGNDLLFTSSDGTTKLAHEIESYTNSNGALVAWVNVPLLSATMDTTLYLYYGNPSSTNQQNVTGTWNSNFKAVWHFNGVFADSTSNHYDGANTGTIAATGKISNGRGYVTGDGADNITVAGLLGSPANITLSAWVNLTAKDSSGAEFISLGDHTSLRQDNTGIVGYYYDGSAWNFTPSTTNVLGTGWRYVVYTFDDAGNSQKVYVDGVQIASTTFTTSLSYAGQGANTVIGSHGNGNTTFDFNGTLDEVRVLDTARSAAWVATEYINQSSPTTFYSVGSVETPPATKLAITSVNGGSSPTVGAAFNVVVQSQDAGGTARNVTADTVVTLSVNTGTGTLGGTVTGTITNGSSSVTISGVTYGKAENGVILTATQTNGYTLTAGNSSSFNVSKAVLTVSSGLTANNKVYDRTTAATISSNTVVLAGMLAADTGNVSLSTNGYTATFASATVGSGKTVTVSGLTLTGSAAGNYILTQPSLSNNITAKALTVTGVTSSNKFYDGNTSATLSTGGAVLVGVIAGDTVTLNSAGATGAFSSASVGLGKTVTLGGLALGGADAANYSITQPTTTASIFAAIVIGTATGSLNWSAITNGSGPGGQPSAGDTITVYQGATLTVDVTNGVCASIQLGPSSGNGPGYLVFNTNSQATVFGAVTLGMNGGSAGIFGSVTMTSGGTLNCQSLVTFANPISPSLWTPGSGTLQLTATNSLPSTVFTNFNRLILATGTTTLGMAVTVTNLTQGGGNLALSSNALTVITAHYAGTNTISGTGTYTNNNGLFETASTSGVAGNLTTSGAKTLAAASFLFDGATAQVTSGSLPASVASLTIGNAAGVTLSQNTTATNLALTAGNLTTAAYQLNLVNTNNSAISGGNGASYVIGTLQKSFGSGTNQSFTFPIGTATAYSPVTLSSLNIGGSGSPAIAFQSANGEQPQLGTSGIDTNRSVNRYWTLTQSGSTFTNYTITFNYLAGDLDAGAAPGSFIVQIYTNSTWSSVTTVGTPTSTVTVVTNYTAGSVSFAIGDPGPFAKLQLLLPGETAAPGTPSGKTGTPNSEIAGLAFNVTVNAVDANFNIINTNDTVAITSSDGAASLPANAPLVAGAKTFSVTLNTAGSATITASDVTHAGITANTSPSVTVVLTGTQSITFPSPGNQTYGVVPITLAATASSGLPVSYTVTSGPATVSSNLLTITGVGSVTVQATQPGNVYWNAATPVSQTITIAQKAITGNITASNKTYDRTNTATIATRTLTGVVGSDVVSLTGGTATFSDKLVGSGKTVIATGLSLTGANAGNYTLASTSATNTANITALALTVTGITANNKMYDGTTTATINTGGAVLVGVLAGDTVTLNTGSATGAFNTASAGSGKTVTVSGLTLGGADAGNYSITQPTTTASIYAAIAIISSMNWSAISTGSGPGGQPGSNDTITVSQNATLTVDVTNGVCASIGLGTTGTGPGYLVFNSGSRVTISGVLTFGTSGNVGGAFGTLTMTSGGTLICQSLVAFLNTYSPSSWTPGSGTVQLTANNSLPATVFTNFNNLIVSAGTTTLSMAVTITNLTQSGGDIALGANALTAINSHYAGTNLVSGTGAYTNNSGIFETAKASGVAGNLTTSGTKSFAAAKFLFDGTVAQVASATMPATVASITVSNAAGVTLSQSTTTTNLALTAGNVTTAANQLNVAGTNNAAISGGSSTSYVVGTLQKAFGSGTNQSFTFPIGTTAAYTPVALSSLNAGGSGSRTITLQSTDGDHPQLASSGITTNQSVNRYWTLTQSGSTITNYNITFNYPTNDLDAEAYPGSFIAQIYTNSTWSTAAILGTPTSTAIVVTNYATGSATFAIGDPVSNQTITFTSPGNQVYGVGPIALTATASSGLTVTYSVSGPATVTNSTLYINGIGSVFIVASQSGNGSYGAATPVNDTILISPKALTVASGIVANNKVYDGLTAATISSNNVALSGVVAGDAGNVNLSTNGYTASFASATVGSGKPVMVGGLTLTGNAATNYTLTQPGLSAAITPATVTVTANDTNRIYGAANPGFTASYSGFVGSDNASVLSGNPIFSTPANTASSVAGSTYPIGVTNGTLGATNYAFTFVSGQLTVTRASTTNTVSASANPSPTGSNVTFTATLTAVLPGSGTPTSTVQFLADGSPLGSPVTLAGGIANLVTNSLSHGTHAIAAQYAGDGNFFGSTNNLSQVVNAPPVAAGDVLLRNPYAGAKVRTATLLANDTDPDGDSLTFVSVSATSASGGTNVLRGGWICYSPPSGFTNADSFTYVVADGYGLQATGTVSVAILADSAPAQNIGGIDNLGNGSSLIHFSGIPGRTYIVQYATNPVTPVWLPLGTNTADAFGKIDYTDSPATNSPARFYRATNP